MINLFKKHKKKVNPIIQKDTEAKEFKSIVPPEWNDGSKLVTIDDLKKNDFWDDLIKIDDYTRDFVSKANDFIKKIKKIEPEKCTSVSEARKIYDDLENQVYQLNDNINAFRNELINFYNNNLNQSLEITFDKRFM